MGTEKRPPLVGTQGAPQIFTLHQLRLFDYLWLRVPELSKPQPI